MRRWCKSIPNNLASWCNGNTGDFGSLVPGSNPGEATNSKKVLLKNILWDRAVGQLVGLITRRSGVRIPLPLLKRRHAASNYTLLWIKGKKRLLKL